MGLFRTVPDKEGCGLLSSPAASELILLFICCCELPRGVSGLLPSEGFGTVPLSKLFKLLKLIPVAGVRIGGMAVGGAMLVFESLPPVIPVDPDNDGTDTG